MRTLGVCLLALQGVSTEGAPVSHGVVDLVLRSSPIAKIVLIILAIFSILSWAIVLYKWVEVARAGRQSSSFLEVFRRSAKFSEVQAVCRTLSNSPLVGLFQAGYAEINAQIRGPAPGGEGRPAGASARPTLRSLDAVDRALLRAAAVEVNRLERRLTFLASTASITPFIGLFGTVWGIMDAFHEIGQAGSASIVVVAPGISEALITTAMGLLAAIPAAVFFNFFSSRARVLTSMMDDFALEFLNIVERNFT